MNKFFQNFGKKKDEGGPDATPDSEFAEEATKPATEASFDSTIGISSPIDEMCEENELSTPTPIPDSLNGGTNEISPGHDITVFNYRLRLNPSLITATSSTLVLILLAWHLVFRRKQRRQRRIWKKDSQRILTRVEDVVLQLEERDEEVDLLQQQIKTLQEAAKKEQDRMKLEYKLVIEGKDRECQELRATIAELQSRLKETENRLEKAASDLKLCGEAQQDHECLILEQKLQASQLSSALADREAKIEEFENTNRTQAGRIQDLQQKIKADALKAEQIIGELMSERDDRFNILQQENDAIKTTIMGMLKQTQERYDADKVLLKKEMRKRDEKIRSLQEELWQSNTLLKRLQEEKAANGKLSQSMHKLITDITETKEQPLKRGKERRSSTYDAAETILESDGNCKELKELQNLLQETGTQAV